MRALLLALMVVFVPVAGAQAASFTVDNTTDAAGPCPTPTTCSLRQAIESTNAAAGNDTIGFNLAPGSVIELAAGSLIVDPTTATDTLTIAGPGASALLVRRAAAAPGFPLFVIQNGANTTVAGFTISGGLGGQFEGGALMNNAPSFLIGMLITGNQSDAQGAGASGAIVSFVPMLIANSTISGNRVVNAGPGQSSGAIVTLDAVQLKNTTISDNRVTGAGPGDAGAILGFGPTFALNSTVAGNSVDNGTGGLGAGSTLGIANTVLAGNTGTAPDCAGEIVSQGYNLVGNSTGCTFTATTGDLVGTGGAPVDPLLGALANNGGATPTRPLLAGSPARDAGNPAGTSDAVPAGPPALVPCPTIDQRGVSRPVGARCDIGAFELTQSATPPTAFVAPDVDHLKCYAAGQRRFTRRNQRLRDQFTTKTITARVRSTKRLCNPVQKDGGKVAHPKAHLVCYATRDRATTFTARQVLIENQFGFQQIDVLRPESLCVPSNKRKGRKKVSRKPDPARSIDSFRCYAVKKVAQTRTVKLKDQFGTTSSVVVKLGRLCNPVKRGNKKIRRPAAHLACYTIKDAKKFKSRTVRVRNAFGTPLLRVRKSETLCLPSLKTVLPAAASAATRSPSAKRWAAAATMRGR